MANATETNCAIQSIFLSHFKRLSSFCVCFSFYKMRVVAIKCAKDLPAVVILIWMSLGLAMYSVIANDFFYQKRRLCKPKVIPAARHIKCRVLFFMKSSFLTTKVNRWMREKITSATKKTRKKERKKKKKSQATSINK